MQTVGLTVYSSGAFSHGKEAYATIQSVRLAILGPLADFSQNLREQLISRGSHPCTEHPPRALQAALRILLSNTTEPTWKRHCTPPTQILVGVCVLLDTRESNWCTMGKHRLAVLLNCFLTSLGKAFFFYYN